MERDIFMNLSPWDHRYSIKEGDFLALATYFSEHAVIYYQGLVELALVEEFVERGLCPESLVTELKQALQNLDSHQVYLEEKKTQHNIKALINVLSRNVTPANRPFIHLGATSMDIVDTALSLRFKKAHHHLIDPLLKQLMAKLIAIALREKATLQVGRTHGQHAVPITFGFALANYIERLGRLRELAISKANSLCGKLAGAVGAYNAMSLLLKDPLGLEKDLMERLGLNVAPISTQIVPPEFLLEYLQTLIQIMGVLADFADDMRHLQRTEISEVGEFFSQQQVGSSTMPQKRNPINYEHIKSLWKATLPKLQTCYLDQLSEHQRDLTNSASQRFYSDIPIALFHVLKRANQVLQHFVVDHKKMNKNLKLQKDFIIAEPLYILLAQRGHQNAHETVRKLTLKAEKEQKTLQQALQEDNELMSLIAKIPPQQQEVLFNVEQYIGQAVIKTEAICQKYQESSND